jgi:Zn-dependent protease
MLLLEPKPTPYDLRWSMFGIPIRVHPMFWLISAVLGWGWFQAGDGGAQGLAYVGLWVFCVFVSILIHEMGHVVAGQIFGTRGYIVLYGFGGLAIGSNNLRSRWQRIIVSLAGPGAQFLLLGVVWLIYEPVLRSLAGGDYFRPVGLTLFMLWIINLFWPILNLLPIWPLDGGMVSRELFEGSSRANGRRYSLILSMVVAIVLALQILMSQGANPGLIPGLKQWMPFGPLTAIFFGLFAFQSYQEIQEERYRRRNWDDDRLPWER